MTNHETDLAIEPSSSKQSVPETLLINISPVESRVAILREGVLSEIYIERYHDMGLVGNIYIGTVMLVLPGMQACFIDIGLERTAFLHANDIKQPKHKPKDKQKAIYDFLNSLSFVLVTDHRFSLSPAPKFRKLAYKKAKAENPEKLLIQSRVSEGQKILVQVTKDKMGTKGARLTTNISIPSRFLVYLPDESSIGISQRIKNTAERTRIRNDLQMLMQNANLDGGLIARTMSENVLAEKLQEDINYLVQLWRTIQQRKNQINSTVKSALIYQELSLPFRALRDLVHDNTQEILIDDADAFNRLQQFADDFAPTISPRLKAYRNPSSIFDAYQVEKPLRNALKRRVDLKSGGYLIIDQTEAMTTIDINTGSFVGKNNLEDTVYQTNLEAVYAIAHQLRLRNVGGIIILDFIDMQEEHHRQSIFVSLTDELAKDYARTNVAPMSEIGLVEMTRKRTRESLEKQLCEPCHACDGRGFVKTAETVCFDIFRDLMRLARSGNRSKHITITGHKKVIDRLLTHEADSIADLEYVLNCSINVKIEYTCNQEKYEVILE